MPAKNKWIQGAVQNKGALRKKMGVKGDKTIPMDKLTSEAKTAKSPTTRRQANLAITLKKMKKK